jgi:hypothetical protein
MPAVAPYIPNKDADYNSWLINFATLIEASPMTYGLQASDATTISTAEAAWVAAYALVTSSATKTAATVQAKNTERVSSLNVVRPYAQTISLNPGVSSSNKIALGLNPRTSTPAPIAAPVTYPNITIVSANSLSHIISFRDSASSPSVKAKPYGVLQMYLYGTASATAITDPSVLGFLGGKTKSPFTQTWPSGARGETAYYAARWVTRTGKLGPWSPIVSFIVP